MTSTRAHTFLPLGTTVLTYDGAGSLFFLGAAVLLRWPTLFHRLLLVHRRLPATVSLELMLVTAAEECP